MALLVAEPAYNPSKADLKTVALKGHFVSLNDANNGVKTGAIPYNKAVVDRNKALYATKKGLCDVCQSAKDEVRSTFGFSSPEFKQVSKIKFTKLAKVD